MADVNAPSPFATTSSPADAVSAVVLDYGNVLYAWEPMAAVAGYVSANDWEEFVVDGGFLTWNERLDRGEPLRAGCSPTTPGPTPAALTGRRSSPYTVSASPNR